MPYRVCKSFEVESGHMLSKHPDLCRFPHGHSRRVDVVLAGETLDQNDMLCDFKVIKLAVRGFVRQFDHSIALNSNDPFLEKLGPMRERAVVFENQDPTTEAMARRIFDFIAAELRAGKTYRDDSGHEYRFPPGVTVERVRVTETSSSWAEYGR
jgi:6-pyruvoyltetrahydropterin/6-carboxytetrahydropterin synthase